MWTGEAYYDGPRMGRWAWADPLRDGSRSAVGSRGQLNLAGPAGRGKVAFHPPETEATFGTGMGHAAAQATKA